VQGWDEHLAETWDSADSTENVLTFPTTPVAPQIGILAAVRGGLETDTALRARVSVIVGPGATLRGIANRLQPVYTAAATATHTAPTVDELARGIAVYSQFYLPLGSMAAYRDGLRIPVPIEIEQTSGHWIVNGDTIRLWARSFPTAAAAQLDRRPARLPLPDPTALPAEVTAFLLAHPTPLARGIHLSTRVTTNPFAAVFFFLETMRQLGTGAVEVALTFLDGLVNHQVQLLAALSAGNAVLRRLEAVLSPAPAGLSAQQAASLARGSGMLQRALRPAGAMVPHVDLPETLQQLANRPGGIGGWQAVVPDDPAGGRHRMVLGRDTLAGALGNFVSNGHTYSGAAYGGRIPPAAFIANHAALINPTGDAQLAARLQIVQAITVNEGFLDAVRMRDRGILSIGMQQWSAHADLELPALLHRYKDLAPDEFLLFFQLHGLDVRADGMDAHGNPRFMQQRIQPNGNRADLVPWNARRDFYGGNTAGATTTFRTDWAARSRLPAVASLRFRAAQILEAAGRFDRIVREVGSITVGGNPVPLTNLITSQRGVALILDAHINRPNDVPADLQAAANAAGPQPNANQLDQAVTNQYAPIRHTHNTPQRNANINALGLNPNHGSFAGW
jgi:hypothetical protein